MTNPNIDKVKGAVKETVGNVTGNENLQAEGKTDQAKGSAKQALENVKEGAAKVVAEIKNVAAGKARDHAETAEKKTERPT